MKKLGLILFLIFTTSTLFAQKSFQTYYEMKDFTSASPGAFKFGLYGYENPAILNYNRNVFDLEFITSEALSKSISDFSRWGLFYGSEKMGFGALTTKKGDKAVTDYRISTGFGNTIFGMGLTYGWSAGDADYFGKSNLYTIGALYRPISNLSIAGSYTKALSNSDDEFVGELAIRPIGTYPLTLFGDFSIMDKQNLEESGWSAGVSWEMVNGIRVNGRYFKDKTLSIGVDLSLGTFGVSSIAQFDENTKSAYNSYGVRLGGKDRTIFDIISIPKNYVVMDLKGEVSYQKFKYFDNSMTLMSILESIEKAKNEKSITGMIINTSDFSANKAILWEIREKLLEFKKTGKKVVIFIERPSLDLYTFATVADKIVLEDLGSLRLEGYFMGRSYYKKMLDKIDVGFQEIRLFKYKSAVESFSRESFSEGDKEQRQAIIDDWYDVAKKTVSNARNISPEKFDELVNMQISYLPKDALANKLVDQLGRWGDRDSIVRKFDASMENIIPIQSLFTMPDPIDDQWAYNEKKVAVVYAIGACDMNEGIAARSLVEDLNRAYSDPSIGAIVLRVDSPGGDALASDYIAKAIRQNKGKKPLIVSQGMVAGSGGYWLSMDGDMILASPVTITGSIGVISGFIYDNGLKDSLGISYDYVKRGKYADMGSAYTLPLLPIGLPVRKLNDDEKKQVETSMLSLYEDFVNLVAQGRKMTPEKVKEIAQGRIRSGNAGKANGLVDEIGGLDKAIEIAKQKAGISSKDKYHIVEFPEPRMFNFGAFLPGLIGINIDKPKSDMKMFQFLIENNGVPMPMIPLDMIEKQGY